ncbi:MAG: hypothetical protein JO266_09315 [Acidobacteria bacterium]|nr:hypothetical protein [Acidobacteriota bacterium]
MWNLRPSISYLRAASLLVDALIAGLRVIGPIVRRLSKIEHLIADAEIGAHLPRAHKDHDEIRGGRVMVLIGQSKRIASSAGALA